MSFTVATGVITKGDTADLLLTATTDGSTAFDLSGATLETTFLKEDGDEMSIPDANHTITDAANGEYKIVWDATYKTDDLKSGDEITFKTKITQSGTVTTVWFVGALRIRESEVYKQ